MFGLMVNGELRQANLKMLFERAKQYETASFKGLYNFIQFIEKLRLNSGDLGAAKIIGENENVIRIMSIHKSKGLEFPVVFLSSTGKQFNLMDLNQNILLHQDIGIGVKYINYERQVQYDTLSKKAIRNKMLVETLSEEMRILYVALTRAKEKLIITSLEKDYDKKIEKMEKQIQMYTKNGNKINPILVKKYKKYIDWILLTYFYQKEEVKNISELYIHTKEEILNNCKIDKKEEIDVMEILEEKIKNENNSNKDIVEKLNYEYPYMLSTKIPTKTSVTKIKEIEQETKVKDKVNKKIEQQNTSFQIPNFMKDEEKVVTGAQKGTLIHLCMQKLDFTQKYNEEKIRKLIKSLETKELITQIESENINTSSILTFTKSNIWNELKQAKQIEKEKPFYINIPAKELYNENIDEQILVQGIIDLYYIDKKDNLILLDYKTDYVQNGKEEELVNKYIRQLELYKKALEEALNKKVYKTYIYSTYIGKEIEVNI